MGIDWASASDHVLWSQAADEHAGEAFGELFERHADRVYAHCFGRTGSWSMAEERPANRRTAYRQKADSVANYAIESRSWLGRNSQHIPVDAFEEIPSMLVLVRDSLNTARGALSSGQDEIAISGFLGAAAAFNAGTATLFARLPGDPQIDPPPPLPVGLGILV